MKNAIDICYVNTETKWYKILWWWPRGRHGFRWAEHKSLQSLTYLPGNILSETSWQMYAKMYVKWLWSFGIQVLFKSFIDPESNAQFSVTVSPGVMEISSTAPLVITKIIADLCVKQNELNVLDLVKRMPHLERMRISGFDVAEFHD